MLGGEFTAGPRPRRGFRVFARIPYAIAPPSVRWLMSEPIRVVVADDQALVRGGFRMLVDSAAGMEVVGEAATAPRRCDWRANVRTWC